MTVEDRFDPAALLDLLGGEAAPRTFSQLPLVPTPLMCHGH
jgi:hypothetical protein